MDEYMRFVRNKALLDMWSRMSDDDRHTLVQMLNNNRYDGIVKKSDAAYGNVILNQHSFKTDVLANIVGNVITDGAIFIGKRLLSSLFH